MFQRFGKYLALALLVVFAFLFFVFPQRAKADYCARQRVINMNVYSCRDATIPEGCGTRCKYEGALEFIANCDPDTCTTLNVNAPDYGINCSDSIVDSCWDCGLTDQFFGEGFGCWVLGTPTPGPTATPTGGGCGASCTDSSQCSANLSCAPGDPGSRVCWGSSCVSDPPPPPGCDATVPTNLQANLRPSVQAADLSWTIGANGNSEKLKMDTSPSKVAQECPNGCFIEKSFSDPTTNSYYTGSSGNYFAYGSKYYWKIINKKDASCQASTTANFISKCEVKANNISLPKGSRQPVNANLTIDQLNYVDRVVFTLGDKTIASFNGSASSTVTDSDSSDGFKVDIQGEKSGSTTTLSIQTYYKENLGAVACNKTINITVTQALAWWQVKDADVVTSGDVKSDIPYGTCGASCTEKFNLRRTASEGYNGVTIYGALSSYDFGSGNPLGANRVGELNDWLVSADVSSVPTYDYAYFNSKIPTGAVVTSVNNANVKQRIEAGGTAYNGYYWYKATGNLNLGVISIPNGKKVILLVEAGNLTIGRNVSLTNGRAFFMAVVSRNINIGSSVTSIKGLYLADGTFATGSRNPTADLLLNVRGSVVSYGGVNLQRDRKGSNDTSPSEVFTYGPELILMFPPDLKSTKVSWKEVAP